MTEKRRVRTVFQPTVEIEVELPEYIALQRQGLLAATPPHPVGRPAAEKKNDTIEKAG